MGKNKLTNPWVLSIASGIFLWLAFPPLPFLPFIFIGFIPLLILEEKYQYSTDRRKTMKLAGFTFLAFFIWNILTTWWVYNSTAAGSIFAFAANSLLMTLPFLLYHKVRKGTNDRLALICFVSFWISFEYIHLSWELTWPWLTLGNAFSMSVWLVQWYEYTGALGGSLWALLINIAIYSIIKNYLLSAREKGKGNISIRSVISLALLFFIPLTTSLLTKEDLAGMRKTGVVIVQPNVDPYSEKFDPAELFNQVENLIRLSEKEIDEETELVIWPETAIPKGVNEDNLLDDKTVLHLKEFLERHPRISLISGINTFKIYRSKETPTARDMQNGEGYYDFFNTALMINREGETDVYHKSVLVPGVERMPYPGVFSFLEPLAIDLGGISGSLGTQEEPSVFNVSDSLIVGPIICYESIFGGYVAGFVRKGANILTIITNDGWWGNTPGYRQHFYYGILRAIESRRSIARAANTGISCFIDPAGNVFQKTPYWVKEVRKMSLPVSDKITFYVRYGNYIGRISLFASILLALIGITQGYLRKKNKWFLN